MTGCAIDRNSSSSSFLGGDGAPWVVVGIARLPIAPRKTLTNSRSRQRSGVITIACGGGGLVWGKRPLLGVGTRRPMVAPILTEVHFSDRAQWVVALHEQRLGSD